MSTTKNKIKKLKKVNRNVLQDVCKNDNSNRFKTKIVENKKKKTSKYSFKYEEV